MQILPCSRLTTDCPCRDRLYVFDSGRFSWNLFLNCDTGFVFYFERELYFFLTRKTVFSKKTTLSCIFFRISIDNLGPYICYTISCFKISINSEGVTTNVFSGKCLPFPVTRKASLSCADNVTA